MHDTQNRRDTLDTLAAHLNNENHAADSLIRTRSASRGPSLSIGSIKYRRDSFSILNGVGGYFYLFAIIIIGSGPMV